MITILNNKTSKALILLSCLSLVACGGSASKSSDPITTASPTPMSTATPTPIITTETTNVADIVAPIITLQGELTLALTFKQPYIEKGATAKDNIDEAVNVAIGGRVDTNAAGVYRLTYSAVDQAGNQATPIFRDVTVLPPFLDEKPPVITLIGASTVKLLLNEDFTDDGVTASDDIDGEVDVSSTHNINNTVVGTYTVTYTATDSSNNSAVITRTVNVIEKRPFITQWKIENADTQITIPTWHEASYDYRVDWGDGTPSDHWDETNNPAKHTYAEPGTYKVTISGMFQQIHFDGGQGDGFGIDRDKIISVDQWGDMKWRWMGAAFWGCSNLVVNATDAPDLSVTQRMNGMFRDATSFNNDISHWDVSNINNMASIFRGATAFNQDLSTWNTSKVTNMRYAFADATTFDQSLGAWNVQANNNFKDMFTGVTLSTEKYDALLIGWAAQENIKSGKEFDAGNSRYSAIGQVAKDKLVLKGWTILDGGMAP